MSARETALAAPLHPREPRRPHEVLGLGRSLRRPRSLFSFAMNALVTLLTLAALVPLISVVWMLLVRGGRQLSLALFTQLPPSPMEPGGGFGNAILGTFVMVTLAAVIAVPFGLFGAIYLAEVGPTTRLATAVRFAAKVLTGFPSILAGVFAYGAVVITTGGFSAYAGAVALAILMLPTIMLTAEQAIRAVPPGIRLAALGLGATQAQTVRMILLPAAFPGILTGVMLAIARAAGETAPLLFTALFSNYWLFNPAHHGLDALKAPTASLAVLIYNFSGVPYRNQVELAWAAALVLVLMVLVTNLIAQAIGRRQVR